MNSKRVFCSSGPTQSILPNLQLLIAILLAISGCGESVPQPIAIPKASDPTVPQAAAEAQPTGAITDSNEPAPAKAEAAIPDEPLLVEDIKPGTPEGHFYKTILTRLKEENFDELEKLIRFAREKEITSPHGHTILDMTYELLSKPEETDELRWQKRFETLARWREAKPESVIPRIAEGRAHILHGWHVRGGGFAHTVSEENFRLFHERIARAREILEEAAELKDRDPALYAITSLVAKAESWPREEVDKLVDQSFEVDPNYYSTYTYVAELLLPRWGGAPGDVEKFALEIADRLGDDDGLDAYLRIANQIHCFGEDVFNTFDVEKLAQAIPVIKERYPAEGQLIQFACLTACKVNDHETAHELFAMINKWAPKVWQSRQVFENYKTWSDPRVVRGKEKILIWAHPAGVHSVAVSPEGKLILSTGPDPVPVKLWNAKDGSFLNALPGIEGHSMHSAFSTSGDYLAVTGSRQNDGYVLLWALRSGGKSRVLSGHKGDINDIAFSDDEKWLATASSSDGTVRIWEVSTGQEYLQLPAFKNVRDLKFVDDDKSILVADESGLAKWNLESGEEATLPEPKESFSAEKIIQLDDGRIIGVGFVSKIGYGIFDLANNSFRVLNTSNKPHIGSPLGFSPDGRFLIALAAPLHGTSAFDIGVYDVDTLQKVHDFQGHWAAGVEIAFSPDGKTLITAGPDGTVRLWDFEAATKDFQAAEPTESKPAGELSTTEH